MYLHSLRPGAFAVLEHMLLGYQHSPDIFHALLTQLKQLLITLQKEAGEYIEPDDGKPASGEPPKESDAANKDPGDREGDTKRIKLTPVEVDPSNDICVMR